MLPGGRPDPTFGFSDLLLDRPINSILQFSSLVYLSVDEISYVQVGVLDRVHLSQAEAPIKVTFHSVS